MPSNGPKDGKNNHTDSQNMNDDVNEEKEKEIPDDKTKEAEKKEGEPKEAKVESEEDDDEEEESDEEDPLYAQLASKYNLKVEEKLKELEEEDEPEEAKPDSASSRNIDLGKLTKRYNPQQSSALQHILVEYGLPNPEEEKYEKYERYKKQKKKEKKKKRRDSKSDFDWDDTAGERTRPEYFDSIYHDRDNLPDYLQDDYAEKLEEKIANQRKAIQKRSEELEKKLQERQERHLASMRFQKNLQRHELSHDAGFLRAIPKSNAYKFIQHENKLRGAGKFKTKADVEEFWENTKDPIALKSYMNRMDLAIESSKASSQPQLSTLEDSFISSRTSSMSSITTNEKERTVTDFRPLTQIEEIKEPSRPNTRDANAAAPWAITQGFPAKLGPLKKVQDPYTIAKQAAVELDKKHPMKELPPMYCFTMEVGEKPPDPQEVMKQMQSERREKERRLFVKRIRKMYHLAQANTAATQRIMEKRNDFQIDYEAAPTDTWLSAYDFDDQASESLTEEEKFLKSHPWLQHIHHRAIGTIAEESEPPSGFNSQKTSASLVRQRTVPSRSASKLSSVASRSAQRPLPLSIDSVTENAPVVEAKCLSTLWTNYMGVGKSVFAK